MEYDPRKHNRRSIRLRGYDYSYAGMYFVTICVNERRFLFGQIADETMRPSPAGRMMQTVWNRIPAAFPGVGVDRFVVMPNHVHGIIAVTTGPVGLGIEPQREQPRPCPTRGTGYALSDVVQWFKSAAINKYKAAVQRRGRQQYAGRLWQRNYYEHVIRDAESLARIRRYIAENPLRWHLDRENPDRTGDDEFDEWLDSLSDQQEITDECP